MSVSRDLLSPEGRMGPGAFLKYALVLIAIQFVLGLVPLLGLGPVAGLGISVLSLLLIYPWVVLWIKRLHDAGHSGWLLLIFLVIWIILSVISALLVRKMFGIDMSSLRGSTDASAVFAAAREAAQRTALPSAIGSAAVSLLTVLFANMLLSPDSGPNEFGDPAPR